MLQFGRLLSFPLTFKQLTNKIKSINIQDINIIEKFNNIFITSVANEHSVEIQVLDPILSVKSPVKLYCDCEFFQYNLAFSLYKNNSLLHPEKFVLKPPKKKNVSMQLSGCKHIILVSQSLWVNKNNIFKLNNI